MKFYTEYTLMKKEYSSYGEEEKAILKGYDKEVLNTRINEECAYLINSEGYQSPKDPDAPYTKTVVKTGSRIVFHIVETQVDLSGAPWMTGVEEVKEVKEPVDLEKTVQNIVVGMIKDIVAILKGEKQIEEAPEDGKPKLGYAFTWCTSVKHEFEWLRNHFGEAVRYNNGKQRK